jgi:SAM-dependent methyltransferase
MPAKNLPSLRHLRAIVHGAIAHGRALLGSESRYEIVAGYSHREKTGHFDDTGNKDEWQREVYLYAAELMQKKAWKTVYDVGCGSGFKLVHYLGDYETIGIDLPQTVDFLLRTYPDRIWRAVPFSDRSLAPADLVICSDVIEHVADPDELLAFLEAITKRDIIISTPERNFLYPPTSRHRFGAPSNPTHLREWDARELATYLSRRFDIVRHEITNQRQGTQMIHCVRR